MSMASQPDQASTVVLTVPIKQVMTNPYQPRRTFCKEAIEELAASIQAVGIIHPPLVRVVGDHYELIAGERRLRAAKEAGLTEIPVMVKSLENRLSAEAALIENVQRIDLNPIEIARALEQLMNQFDYKQEQVAEKVGKKRSSVANYLRLLTLPKAIQEAIVGEACSMGHAKVLLSIGTKEKQSSLFQRMLREHLSVRQLEQAVLEEKSYDATRERTSDCHVEDLEKRLESALGTRVSIQSRGEGGTLQITYYSLDDLERLLEQIGLE